MILAASGSLRRNSSNGAVLRAAAEAAARDGIEVVAGDWVRSLPQFDPDLEAAPPGSVVEFRSACEQAAAVLLAVPEYAFGIPGAFKNALDWTVGSGSLYDKPVGVIDVALPGRGERARRALDLVLEAVGARVARYRIADPTATDELRALIADLIRRRPLDCQTAAVRLAQDALSRR
jgi:chromate reductase, NAD(P)H dehydrogenase (quinone)